MKAQFHEFDIKTLLQQIQDLLQYIQELVAEDERKKEEILQENLELKQLATPYDTDGGLSCEDYRQTERH